MSAGAGHDLHEFDRRIEEVLSKLARADFSTNRRETQIGFCVAMPTGQLLVWQARMPRQPMACNAALPSATPSAPSAIALAKSAGVRKPPVAIKVTSPRAFLSRCRRARAIAGMVGTEMLSRKISGAAPVPPPRPSKMR